MMLEDALFIIYLLTFAILTSRMAYEKNRNVFVWFFIGGWFNVGAFLVMLCLKPINKEDAFGFGANTIKSYTAVYSIIAILMILMVIVCFSQQKRNKSIKGEWNCHEICLNLTEELLNSTPAGEWYTLTRKKTPEEMNTYSNVAFYEDGTYKFVLIVEGKRNEIRGTYEKTSEIREMNRTNYALYDNRGNEVDAFVVYDKEADMIYDVDVMLDGGTLNYKRRGS